MKTAIDYWAQFLSNEKLDPKILVDEKDILVLIRLCEKLAEDGSPYQGKGVSHVAKMNARRKVCQTCFDLGIDLTKLKRSKFHGGKKVAMGRGLLDVWNEEYAKRFGSNVGTPGKAEEIRRNIVTKLSKEKP